MTLFECLEYKTIKHYEYSMKMGFMEEVMDFSGHYEISPITNHMGKDKHRLKMHSTYLRKNSSELKMLEQDWESTLSARQKTLRQAAMLVRGTFC